MRTFSTYQRFWYWYILWSFSIVVVLISVTFSFQRDFSCFWRATQIKIEAVACVQLWVTVAFFGHFCYGWRTTSWKIRHVLFPRSFLALEGLLALCRLHVRNFYGCRCRVRFHQRRSSTIYSCSSNQTSKTRFFRWTAGRSVDTEWNSKGRLLIERNSLNDLDSSFGIKAIKNLARVYILLSYKGLKGSHSETLSSTYCNVQIV